VTLVEPHVDVNPDPPDQVAPSAAARTRPTPSTPPAPGRWRAPRRHAKRALLIVAILVVIVGAHRVLVTDLMHRTRADHRASNFAARSNVIGEGDAVAVLQIETIGLNVIVAEGTTNDVLRGGPGHDVRTPLPGEGGHSLIAGRASRYGGDFSRLDELVEGDAIVLQVRNGPVIAYEVDEIRTASAGERLEQTGERLSLVTATGPLSGDVRVVAATPVAAANSTGVPASLDGATYGVTEGVAPWAILLIRLAVIGVLLRVAWAVPLRTRPLLAIVVIGPMVALASIGMLDLEPIVSRLY
jgi:sortase A